MATFNKFNVFAEEVYEKVHNIGSDSLKLMLTNGAPAATDTHFDTSVDFRLEPSNAADLATAGGYTAGGQAITITSAAQTAGLYKLVGNDVVWTATAAGIGPFRYVVLYNNTAGAASTRPIIGWWDYGSSITLANGETFTTDLDQVNGILTHQ